MRVYVAGRITELDKVREVQDGLRERGHEITHDWARAVPETALRAGGVGAAYLAVPDIDKLRYAVDNLSGVLRAEIVIAVCGLGWVGTYIEIGAAMGRGTPVVIIGTPERESVFWHLSLVQRIDNLSDLWPIVG